MLQINDQITLNNWKAAGKQYRAKAKCGSRHTSQRAKEGKDITRIKDILQSVQMSRRMVLKSAHVYCMLDARHTIAASLAFR